MDTDVLGATGIFRGGDGCGKSGGCAINGSSAIACVSTPFDDTQPDQTSSFRLLKLNQDLCMAYKLFTHWGGLLDVNTCVCANSGLSGHLGVRGGIVRGTLADAYKTPDCGIYQGFVQLLICLAGVSTRVWIIYPGTCEPVGLPC